jgi:glycosyltransferase involved in cell wall biosynthesis
MVTAIGWQQRLECIYADLDLVVSTSINEGTPVALLEAMASGRAFVSTDVGGVRDLMVGAPRSQGGFEVFENGILVPRDAEALVHAVAYIKENSKLRHAMGAAGRRFVKARFSSQRLAEDLEAVYLSLVRAKKIRSQHELSLVADHSPQYLPAEKELS